MGDKEIYDELYRKFKNVHTNILNAIDSLDNITNKIDDTFKINDEVLNKDRIKNIRENLNVKQMVIKNEIIPELLGKL